MSYQLKVISGDFSTFSDSAASGLTTRVWNLSNGQKVRVTLATADFAFLDANAQSHVIDVAGIFTRSGKSWSFASASLAMTLTDIS